ncbi:MAG: hypothetical protein DSZ02_11295 [Gammaproteobacteria bacterium]|nr:MAG: hypothetical protein DSZ02_11295 [Gammaproteobacteria bacterium]
MIRQWLHRRYRPQRYALLPGLLENERLDAETLQRRQQQAIDEMVRFAMENTDYYAEQYAGRIGRTGLVQIEQLPLLTREQVIANRDRMRNRNLRPGSYRLGHTGGSTGTPLAFWYDDHKIELMRAGMMRGYRWSGWRPGEKILNFWGARQDLKTGLRRRYKEFIVAERTLGAWEYDTQTLQRWAETIRSWRPVLLQGYASVLAELARYLLRRRVRLPRGIKGVYSTAEVLHDWQREAMESAFGCPVFNQYGSREVPNIALQCRQGNLHVFTDMVALESVQRKGEARLLVTSLSNRVMPFIRYENGDTGRLREGSCSCGSPFPLMELDLCRSNDLVRTPGGRRVYPSWFVHLLDGIAGVRHYQFVQESPQRMVLKLVSEKPLDREAASALQQRVSDELGLALEIREVDAIARSASGKHRFVIGYSDAG